MLLLNAPQYERCRLNLRANSNLNLTIFTVSSKYIICSIILNCSCHTIFFNQANLFVLNWYNSQMSKTVKQENSINKGIFLDCLKNDPIKKQRNVQSFFTMVLFWDCFILIKRFLKLEIVKQIKIKTATRQWNWSIKP